MYVCPFLFKFNLSSILSWLEFNTLTLNLIALFITDSCISIRLNYFYITFHRIIYISLITLTKRPQKPGPGFSKMQISLYQD